MSERRKTEILLAQYREAYEYLRQHSRFMWQVHSLAIVISGGLIVASFAYVDLWWVRDFVLAIAMAVTWALLIAMKKHRYFADVEVGTLSRLEDELGTKRIQRTTQISGEMPSQKREYWYTQTPEKPYSIEPYFAKKSADKCLGKSMYALLVIITVCIIVNTVMGIIAN